MTKNMYFKFGKKNSEQKSIFILKITCYMYIPVAKEKFVFLPY